MIMLFTDTDMFGPEPTNAPNNKLWSELQKLTGLQSVKESLEALLSSIQHNFHRELVEEYGIGHSRRAIRRV